MNYVGVRRRQTKSITISSLCNVFAESEVISYIGEGRVKEDITAGVIESVVDRGLKPQHLLYGTFVRKIGKTCDAGRIWKICGGIWCGISCGREEIAL